MFRLKILWSGLDLGKWGSVSEREYLPTLVSTFWLYGGLNHVTFLWRFLLAFGALGLVSLSDRLYLYPLLLSASWYVLLTLSKHSLSDDISERRWLTDSGIFLRTEGGWLDCLCTYNGMFPSLVYGRCFPLFRSRVTSKKLTLVRLASTVIFRSLSRKVLHKSFLILSISCGVLLNAYNPSSR